MPIKVLIVEHSAPMRESLTQLINGAADLEVVGATADAVAARGMIRRLNPDVLILDAEMPRTEGVEVLDRLMGSRPLPVILISPAGAAAAESTQKALELGAVDYLTRPRAGNVAAPPGSAEEIRDKIRAACGARLQAATRLAVTCPRSGIPGTQSTPAPARCVPSGTLAPSRSGFSSRLLTERVIAIGASTGGTEAIREVLAALPADMPPIVMVQHMPESFTPSFARRLNGLSKLTVVEAQGDERLQAGVAYLAPGHSHMRVRRGGGGFVLELSREDPVNRHRPSVDVLFRSMAEQVGHSGLGVILTGMGKDGAQGLLAMHQAGAWNIGQDQASCVVYGMPREAAEIGALDEIAGLGEISASLLARLRELDRRTLAG